MNVLIIDDSEDLCNSMRKYLQAHNYNVDCAYDGQKGLRKALSNEYDIILMDVMMPQMNGYEVLKRLKKEGRTTPVILITAKNDSSDMIEGLELGADDYIQKPFNADVLIARIRALARRSNIDDYDSDIIRYGDITLTVSARKLAKEDLQLTLGEGECELMKYLIKNSTVIVPAEKLVQISSQRDADEDKIQGFIENLIKALRFICSKVKIIPIKEVGYKLCY